MNRRPRQNLKPFFSYHGLRVTVRLSIMWHMAENRFPDPRYAAPDGVVAVGGRPEPELLEEAYARGIFPWPVDGYPLLWFSPAERGILFLRCFQQARLEECEIVPPQHSAERKTRAL